MFTIKISDEKKRNVIEVAREVSAIASEFGNNLPKWDGFTNIPSNINCLQKMICDGSDCGGDDWWNNPVVQFELAYQAAEDKMAKNQNADKLREILKRLDEIRPIVLEKQLAIESSYLDRYVTNSESGLRGCAAHREWGHGSRYLPDGQGFYIVSPVDTLSIFLGVLKGAKEAGMDVSCIIAQLKEVFKSSGDLPRPDSSIYEEYCRQHEVRKHIEEMMEELLTK